MKELKELHEKVVKPVLQSRVYLNADPFVDAFITLGHKVSTRAESSEIRLAARKMAKQFNALVARNPDWVKRHVDEPSAIECWKEFLNAIEPKVDAKPTNIPKEEPTPAAQLRRACLKKKKGE